MDDHAKDISEDAAGEAGPNSSLEINLKEQDTGAGGTIILFFIFGLFASLVVGWIIFPKLLYSKKKQPIDFNHVFMLKRSR